MTDQIAKCRRLKELHASSDAWLIPNPWDVGSAKELEAVGFKALATSSSAFAYTLGKQDGDITLDEKIEHTRLLSAATSIPVSVDFEDGFSDDPKEAAQNVARIIETGAAGCSIEDYSRIDQSMLDVNHAVEKLQAVMEVVNASNLDFQIVARAENLLRKHSELDDTIVRLQAYESVGAHVIYPPALTSLDQIKEVRANTERPLNVLAPFFPGVSVTELGAAGATRLSLGGALQRGLTNQFIDQATRMLESGSTS